MHNRIVWLLATIPLVVGGLLLLKAQRPEAPFLVPPTLTPNLVTVNTPTVVTATVGIPDPTLNPAQVELIKVSASGQTTTVAQMVDTGQNGDQKPGDKVFTAKVTLNETAPAAFGFRVAAVFRGQNRVLSPIQQTAALAPTTVPVSLPPDPGDAGKATLAGIDSDNDGVRDDIQRYIIFSYPASQKGRSALSQYTKSFQSFLLSAFNPSTASSEFTAASNGRYCLYAALGFEAGAQARKEIQAELLNTRDRSKAYITASQTLGGSAVGGLAQTEWANRCSFDLSAMVN